MSLMIGVGINGTDNHPAKACTQNGIGAGRRTPMCGAALQRHVNGCATGVLRVFGRAKRFDLGVWLPNSPVMSLRKDLPVANDHRADCRIWAGVPDSALCLLDGNTHELLVSRVGYRHGVELCTLLNRTELGK